MDHKSKILSPEELFGEYARILDEHPDASLPVTVSGNSMAPFLKDGRDTVFLSRIDLPPKRGDIILFRRKNGDYVLHRVYSTDGDRLTMLGDGQTWLEENVPAANTVAKVTSVTRKGKTLTEKSPKWHFYSKIWLTLYPLRPFIAKVHGLTKQAKDKGRT